MVFKEIISNMILKTKFQIWFFIIKKNDFWRNNFRSDFLLWKTISNLTFYYEKKMVFKERISNMILKKEFLKKEFQIWFFI